MQQLREHNYVPVKMYQAGSVKSERVMLVSKIQMHRTLEWGCVI